MGVRMREPHLNVVRSFESVNREDQIELSPSHQYRVIGSPVSSPRHSCERTLSPIFQFDNTTPVKAHSTLSSFTYEDKSSPSSSESMSPTSPHSPSCNNNLSGNLGSPNCVRSRGRFPMMGIGQMLRKRSQVTSPLPTSPKPENSLESRMPPLQQMSPGYTSFNSADMNVFCWLDIFFGTVVYSGGLNPMEDRGELVDNICKCEFCNIPNCIKSICMCFILCIDIFLTSVHCTSTAVMAGKLQELCLVQYKILTIFLGKISPRILQMDISVDRQRCRVLL